MIGQRILTALVLAVALIAGMVVPSIVVTNEARTQTFVEGLDYRLLTVGATTSVERIITGNILDGETVLVSYDVLTGGTVEFASRSRSLSATVGLFKWGSINVQVADSQNREISGASTTPLNDRNRLQVGGNVNFPIGSGWSVGADYRYVDNEEDISSFKQNDFGAHLQTASYLNTTFRFGFRRIIVDNEQSLEDTDLTAYTFGLTNRLPGGVALRYDAQYRENDGGTVSKKVWHHSLGLNWQYRLVTISLSAQSSETTQGLNGRESTRVFAQFRRRFL